MAAFEGSDEDRTENATVYRREEFRRQGTVAVSKEAIGIVLVLSVGLTLYFGISHMAKEFGTLATVFFSFRESLDFNRETFKDLSFASARAFGGMVLPAFVVAIFAGILACAAQVGFFVTWEPINPNWERINPVSGMKKIFSAQGFVEALKALLKIGIASWVAWIMTKGQVTELGSYLHKSVPEISALLLTSVGKIGVALTLSLAVIAVLDYAWQKYQLEKMMKMTRREAKEEMKLRDGDPLIKARIRNIQRRIAGRRMMDEVPKADVVITNPTHLAVALRYDMENMDVPKVVAKGAGVIADKIREIARFNRVPIVENKPLARTLYKELEIGEKIPRELFKAVAEVLAYVYKLKGVRSLGQQTV